MEQSTILVAVNDIFFYTKVRDALLPHGYALERIRTQEDVAAKARMGHPAAMVLDMNDPKLNAFQTLEQLQQSMPVLAFANHEETETWKRARELGVTKIVSRNEFSARMRELLEEVIKLESLKVIKS
ncbi:MAG: response regulator [Nitrospira sp.]|nr:response regulator [Nitrospira sp.]